MVANNRTAEISGWLFERTEPINEAMIQRYRLGQIRKQLLSHDVVAIVIWDPIALRYATGSTNLSARSKHQHCRYALVAASGPSILFEVPAAVHHSHDLPCVDEI
jgi:Xaa-Pro dipeptidase